MEKIKGYEGRTIWKIDEEEAKRMLDGGTNKLYTLYEFCDWGWFYQNSKDRENGRALGEYRAKFSFLIEEIFPYVYAPFVSEGEIVNTYLTDKWKLYDSLFIRRSLLIELLFAFSREDQARKYLEDWKFWKTEVSNGNTTLRLSDWYRYILSSEEWKIRYAAMAEGEEVVYCRFN